VAVPEFEEIAAIGLILGAPILAICHCIQSVD
jgi:hypothetical protein